MCQSGQISILEGFDNSFENVQSILSNSNSFGNRENVRITNSSNYRNSNHRVSCSENFKDLNIFFELAIVRSTRVRIRQS